MIFPKTLSLSCAASFLAVSAAWGVEGMFTPDQIPALSEELAAAGLEMSPAQLADLTGFPMGAVISLGGCTASFVSSSGLAITNHHCARGSVQYNSTPEANYLEDGFLAGRFSDELPAAPGTRIYVTLDVRDVSDEVREGLDRMPSGREVASTIEERSKALVASCEEQAGHRCQVVSFYGGAEFKLIDRLEIRDVRLVYAPGDNVGKYGGDVDNWMWPRHTGDFAFYRGYVGRDGAPNDFDMQNVPYQPEHVLTVSAEGVDTGDFVMVAGYPGNTSRYARLAEVRNTFAWAYPTWIDMLDRWIATIEETAPQGSDARIRYEARLAGLNNFRKNLDGQMEGAERVGLLERRAEREAALNEWVLTRDGGDAYLSAIGQLDLLTEQLAAAERREFWYDNVRRPQLLNAARRLYRLSRERELPDAEREAGYQERDMAFFRQSLEAIDRRFDPEVDLAEWLIFIDGYMEQPGAARVPAFDRQLALDEAASRASREARLRGFYDVSILQDSETRLALMDATSEELEASDDPFLRLAVALYETDIALEEASEELDGRLQRLRPAYMKAIRDWQEANGRVAYPDANSTLRVSYGSVMGPPSAEGDAPAFTFIEEIVAKDTGVEPFNAPPELLSAAEAGSYGPYAPESLGSVPVNFMSDLDVTGGNSGSATLNRRGELVGLLFDGTLDSVNSDWDFDPATTRAIHVDTRYMLWVMDHIDGADRLLHEMDIAGADVPAMPTAEVEPALAEEAEVQPAVVEPVEVEPEASEVAEETGEATEAAEAPAE